MHKFFLANFSQILEIMALHERFVIGIEVRMLRMIRITKSLQLWWVLQMHNFRRYIRHYIHLWSPLGQGKRAPRLKKLGILESPESREWETKRVGGIFKLFQFLGTLLFCDWKAIFFGLSENFSKIVHPPFRKILDPPLIEHVYTKRARCT